MSRLLPDVGDELLLSVPQTEHVRATVDLPLQLTGPRADHQPVSTQAHAIDLSGGGMLVDGLDVLPRLETARRAGLQFTELDQADRVRLMHLAFEMPRQQRRRFA